MRSLLACVAALTMVAPWSAAAQDFAQGRRVFLEKADCGYCHGWAGDGAGQGQSPGGAANLRRSQLGREQLITVIGCGVPGTAMPHFDEQAYTDTALLRHDRSRAGRSHPHATAE